MRLLLGAGVVAVAAVALWVRLAGDRVMDIVDDDYPPWRDEYVDRIHAIFDVPRSVTGL